MSSSIENLINVELYWELAEKLQTRAESWIVPWGKAKESRPAYELQKLAISTEDLKEMRSVALFLWKSQLEWPDFTHKAVSYMADYNQYDVFFCAMLSTSQSLSTEQREVFFDALEKINYSSLLEVLIAIDALGSRATGFTLARLVKKASELLGTVNPVRDSELLKQFTKLGGKDFEVTKALAACMGKEYKQKSNVSKMLSYYGLDYYGQLVWSLANGVECQESLVKWLGFRNLVWGKDERAVWKECCKKVVGCVVNEENLRWVMEEGLAESTRVPLDSRPLLRILEQSGEEGLKVLKVSLQESLIFPEMVKEFRDLFVKAFTEWDSKLSKAFSFLAEHGVVLKECTEFYAEWCAGKEELVELLPELPEGSSALSLAFSKEPVPELAEEYKKWVFNYDPDRFEELIGEEHPFLTKADELGVHREIALLFKEEELVKLDEDWCDEFQYWLLKHPEKIEEAKECSVYSMNSIFRKLGYWDGDVDLEEAENWRGSDLAFAVKTAWGEEYCEAAEKLPWGTKLFDLPGRVALEGDWYVNLLKRNEELPEELTEELIEKLKATNGEVPISQLDEWSGLKGKPGYFGLGADFWREFGEESWVMEVPIQFLEWVNKRAPEFFRLLKGRDVPEDCVMVERTFYTRCDFISFKELPDCLLEKREWTKEISYSADNVEELLALTGEKQRIDWECCGNVPDKVMERAELVVEPAVLGFNLASLGYEQWFSGRRLEEGQKVQMTSYPYYWTTESIERWKDVMELRLRRPVMDSGYDILQHEGYYWVDEDDCVGKGEFIYSLWKSGELTKTARVRYASGENCDLVEKLFIEWVTGKEVGLPSRFNSGEGHGFSFSEAMELADKLPIESLDYWTMVINLLDHAWELDGEKLYRYYPTEEGCYKALEYDFGGRVLAECTRELCWVGIGTAQKQIHFVSDKDYVVYDRPQLAEI